jgi:DNA-binding IclR family transcriptional regulator
VDVSPADATVDPGEPPRRSSVERIHRLLSAFDYAHTRLSLTELSRRAGLPLSTTHRIVADLIDVGMLDRDPSDSLTIGVGIWKLGLLSPTTHGIQRVALPFMQDLYATTGLAVHLAVRSGTTSTIVENLRPRSAERERPHVGQRDPLHLTAVGLSMLAASEAEFQEEYLATLRAGGDLAGAEATRQELARTRASGYAVSSQLSAPRVAIGAPLVNQDGVPMAALSIVLPERTAPQPYGPLVRSTARAVQRTAWEQGIA